MVCDSRTMTGVNGYNCLKEYRNDACANGATYFCVCWRLLNLAQHHLHDLLYILYRVQLKQ